MAAARGRQTASFSSAGAGLASPRQYRGRRVPSAAAPERREAPAPRREPRTDPRGASSGGQQLLELRRVAHGVEVAVVARENPVALVLLDRAAQVLQRRAGLAA